MTRILVRDCPEHAVSALRRAGLSPLAARLFAARGVRDAGEVSTKLEALLPFDQLAGAQAMAARLADAIAMNRRLLVVADYDADGATACAVAMRALTRFGARVEYLVPNRFTDGYGLTPEIVRKAAARGAEVLITVDNGIASHAGVEAARALGLAVLITDHHLPAENLSLPAAEAIVDPNRPGCPFPSKHLAGVGVIFYVMLALRAELRARGAFSNRPEPNLANLLDLVALGTVADVVPLDSNNRILVHQGLTRMRRGQSCAGVRALFTVAGRRMEEATTWDLGYALGPRLNAAGRLTDMSLGIELLLTDDETRALELAQTLDRLNRERREIEADMQEAALAVVDEGIVADTPALVLFQPDWHEGVVGLLASRLKERFHRPVIAFAPGKDGMLKGSGRSIPGFHLRDALDRVAKRHPGLLSRFGGHAMAAGLTLAARDLKAFTRAFVEVAAELIPPAWLSRLVETDGSLPVAWTNLENAREIERGVWGQGFPSPLFWDRFELQDARVVGSRHTRLVLAREGVHFEAMRFFETPELPREIEAVYRLDVNRYNGSERLQLVLEHWSPA